MRYVFFSSFFIHIYSRSSTIQNVAEIQRDSLDKFYKINIIIEAVIGFRPLEKRLNTALNGRTSTVYVKKRFYHTSIEHWKIAVLFHAFQSVWNFFYHEK